jgi:peptidoglycan/LPS O-acetylase OafA/YrhL
MRLKNIDILRGLAASMVMLFHLTGSTNLKTTLASIAHFGFLGVEIFFIISGFVLPYSLDKSNYSIVNFYSFIKSRVVRIYPAYIVSILIALCFATLAGWSKFTIKDILGHLIFLNNSISPVFWTLAIEFQFYMLIGFLPVLFSAKTTGNVLLVLLSVSSIYIGQTFIFRWFPFFCLGILTFNLMYKGLSKLQFIILSIGILVLIFLTHGLFFAFVSLVTVLVIVFIKVKENVISNLLVSLGTISYSLYLTHWDIGRAAVSVAKRVPLLGSNDWFRLFVGIIASIVSAWLMYRFIETPAIRLSKKIKEKGPTRNYSKQVDPISYKNNTEKYND